jgi:predicted anti-sigma-YlaC factor YlaD
VRDYYIVDCEVAREALSARIDGEREPVPSIRVDEHLEECPACRSWLQRVTNQAERLRRAAAPRPAILAVGPFGRKGGAVPDRHRLSWQQWALLTVGVVQVVLAGAQALGLSVGLMGEHGMASGHHLVNESTAWSIALGVVMIGAALRPSGAAGLAGVLGVFAALLAVYVIIDAMSGAVTVVRIVSHVPVVLGAILAVMVWRTSSQPRPAPGSAADEPDIVLPHNASRGGRRGHLWPTDGSAA